MPYDGFGKEFPLHLNHCFSGERDGDDGETTRLINVLRQGAVLVVSGCGVFFAGGSSTTIYGARLRDRSEVKNSMINAASIQGEAREYFRQYF